MAAQILYTKSWMAPGMYAQFGRVAATGAMPPVHQVMVSQVSPWPAYPDERGYGVVASYAHPPAVAVRYPPMYPKWLHPRVDALKRANSVAP